MGKYTSLQSDIYSIFASSAWLAENIKTIPANYATNGLGTEFIRVNILPVGNMIYANLPNASNGQIIVNIFVPTGGGLNRLGIIADKLDTYLVKKTIATTAGGITQFSASALNPIGVDAVNANLYRGDYSISFNYFGT